MTLPHSDPSNPALPSPLFSDVTAVRADHMRANNAAIFTDLAFLDTGNPALVALTGGSFKTSALANANTYNGRSLFTCTAGVSDTPYSGAWRIFGTWNPTDSSGRFVAMLDSSLETWAINYSGAAWGTWTRCVEGAASSGANNLVKFADTSGKVMSDSGVAISTDATMASNSDALLPTQKASKTYADSIKTIISQYGFLPVSQCAISSAVDATGYANFLAKDGANNNVKLSATTVNLIVAFANGFDDYGEKNYIAKITADVVPSAWTGLTTNGTYYLWVDISGGVVTYGITATLINPEYEYSKPAAGTATKHYYIIPERKMYVDGGASYTAVTRVFLGEVVVSGSAVASVITYALKGRYESALTAIPADRTATSINHYLGTKKVKEPVAFVECFNAWATGGYVVGDREYFIHGTSYLNGNAHNGVWVSRLSAGYNTGDNFYTISKTDGATGASPESTYFKWGIILERSF